MKECDLDLFIDIHRVFIDVVPSSLVHHGI